MRVRWLRGVVLVLVTVTLMVFSPWDGPSAVPRMQTRAVSDAAVVPLAAQLAVSRGLGREDRAYWVRRARGGLRANNPGQRLTGRFRRDGVLVSTGSTSVRISLSGLGRGERLSPVTGARPTANRDRVSYRRKSLVEWYANGPLGLERGSRCRGHQPARAVCRWRWRCRDRSMPAP